MDQSPKIKGYLDYISAPWGRLFYESVWSNIKFDNKKILDFGSGFGLTADHLAVNNDVTAVEPDGEMLKYRSKDNKYAQLHGGIEKLSAFPNESYDVIICHNVLEYINDREDLFKEFFRILKPDGVVSIVKHNKYGKIMQKAVFENNVSEALSLLKNGKAVSIHFGEINEYSTDDLMEYCKGLFEISEKFGVRTFFGLQKNEFKSSPDWLTDMLTLEKSAEQIPEFQNIAYFHHIKFKKK